MEFWQMVHSLWPAHSSSGVDFAKAADALGVSEATLRRWRRSAVPLWAIKAVEAHKRAIPAHKDWDGFYFGADGRLYTPYKDLVFSSSDLLHVFVERQFANQDRVAKTKLIEQLAAMTCDEERRAFIEELQTMARSLLSMCDSPMLKRGLGYQKPVARNPAKVKR